MIEMAREVILSGSREKLLGGTYDTSTRHDYRRAGYSQRQLGTVPRTAEQCTRHAVRSDWKVPDAISASGYTEAVLRARSRSRIKPEGVLSSDRSLLVSHRPVLILSDRSQIAMRASAEAGDRRHRGRPDRARTLPRSHRCLRCEYE